MQVIQLALRMFELFCVVIIMGLVGNMLADAYNGAPAVVNYTIFTAAFGMLTLFYTFTAAIVESIAVPIAIIATDVLNVIFFLTNAIALAAELTAHSCTNDEYTSNNKITNLSRGHRERTCREAQASTAFLWFAFAAFVGSAVLSAMAGKGSTSIRGGIRRSRNTAPAPSMSQV